MRNCRQRLVGVPAPAQKQVASLSRGADRRAVPKPPPARAPRTTALAFLCPFLLLAWLGCGGKSTPGDSEVLLYQEVFVDPARPTPRTANFGGADSRALRTVVWFPANSKGPFPMLILAHGFGGLPEKFDAFARSVAREGYAVAAPAFPLTNQNAPGGHEVGFSDFRNQPADLSFVLDRLIEATATQGHPLAGKVDPNCVAALGHSLGGATVVALTRKACCRDPRVQATVLVSAAWILHTNFGPDALLAGPPPTLLLHGKEDRTLDVRLSQQLYEMLLPPRLFVAVAGGGHSDGLESQTEPPVPPRRATQDATLAFLRAVFAGDVSGLSDVLRELEREGHEVRAEGIEMLPRH